VFSVKIHMWSGQEIGVDADIIGYLSEQERGPADKRKEERGTIRKP